MIQHILLQAEWPTKDILLRRNILGDISFCWILWVISIGFSYWSLPKLPRGSVDFKVCQGRTLRPWCGLSVKCLLYCRQTAPYSMEPAAGAFTGTRDSWPLQDGIKDLSSLHPVTIPNCLTCRALVMTLFMLWRVRNCRRYYYYYYS